MLVRAADVPEYVQDGVVDCGITGADLVRESGAEVDELLALGFGACTLEAAVPTESRGERRSTTSTGSVSRPCTRGSPRELLARARDSTSSSCE